MGLWCMRLSTLLYEMGFVPKGPNLTSVRGKQYGKTDVMLLQFSSAIFLLTFLEDCLILPLQLYVHVCLANSLLIFDPLNMLSSHQSSPHRLLPSKLANFTAKQSLAATSAFS